MTDYQRATARIQTTPGAKPKARLLSCSSSRLVLIGIQSAVVKSLRSAYAGALLIWAIVWPGAGAPAAGKTEQPKQRSYTDG